MAGSLNRAQLIGHIGRDPEVRTLANGNKVCNLSLATTESWKDKSSGEKKERTEWHRIVIFNDQLAKIAEQYVKKGSKVFIEGQIQTRKWTDKDGAEKYSTEIVLQGYGGQIILLGGGSADGGGERTERKAAAASRAASAESDDEIPF